MVLRLKDSQEIVVNDGTSKFRIIEFGKAKNNIESGCAIDIDSNGEIIECTQLQGQGAEKVPLGVAIADYKPGEIVSAVTGDGIVIYVQTDNTYNPNSIGLELGLASLGAGRGRFGYIDFPDGNYPNENYRVLGLILEASIRVIKPEEERSVGLTDSPNRYYTKILKLF
tara:strand:- start:555 stop:1061 length:507 start_codon:yes stop_codon:yes gene_type:complete